MSKQKIFLYSTLLVIAYIFFPILFENIPLPGLWFGSLLIYTLSLLIVAPKIIFSKQLIIIYVFTIVYYFLSPNTNNIQESAWFLRRLVPLYVGVSMYTYYFRFPTNTKILKVILWFTISVIILSCITTIIGLLTYPNASRDLASSVGGDIDMARFYNRIGIVGYGFISALAYIIPLFVLFYKKSNINKGKVVFLFAILVSFFTVIKAQYTTQFLLFSLALLMAWFSTEFIVKYKITIIIIIFLIIMLPNGFYVGLLDVMSNIIPGEILKLRLEDVSATLKQSSIESVDTHTADRFARIPFLLTEFGKSPFIGGGKSTGHVFWLDHLSLYGIVGIIPWIMLLIDNYKMIRKRLNKTFIYYQIAFLMFIALGFMKGSGNREQYIILFFISPLGLMLYERNELFKKKKKKQLNDIFER